MEATRSRKVPALCVVLATAWLSSPASARERIGEVGVWDLEQYQEQGFCVAQAQYRSGQSISFFRWKNGLWHFGLSSPEMELTSGKTGFAQLSIDDPQAKEGAFIGDARVMSSKLVLITIGDIAPRRTALETAERMHIRFSGEDMPANDFELRLADMRDMLTEVEKCADGTAAN